MTILSKHLQVDNTAIQTAAVFSLIQFSADEGRVIGVVYLQYLPIMG